jgi:allantoinase
MADFDTVLAGRVILTDREISRGFVAIRDGKTALIGEGLAPAGRENHDFGTGILLPGAIDAQVH